MTGPRSVLALVFAASVVAACAPTDDGAPSHETSPETPTTTPPETPTTTPPETSTPAEPLPLSCRGEGSRTVCDVDGHDDRPIIVWTPGGTSGDASWPVVVALHGGSGSADSMEGIACPSGEPSDADCLHAVGDREGFVTVYPNGTSLAPDGRGRGWNSGGGSEDWTCVGGAACERGIDDIAYISDVLDTVIDAVEIDPQRIYVTGLSNGGAMAHRLGCELSDRIAAIAPIGAGNQFATSEPCVPESAVAVLDIHGTADDCWPYGGGIPTCARRGTTRMQSADETMAIWADINGCDGMSTEPFAGDAPDNDIVVEHDVYAGCDAPTEHLRVIGGGHTWVDGVQYLPERIIGPTFADVTNLDLWAFFEPIRHPG